LSQSANGEGGSAAWRWVGGVRVAVTGQFVPRPAVLGMSQISTGWQIDGQTSPASKREFEIYNCHLARSDL